MPKMDEQALYYELGYGFKAPGKLVLNSLMNRLVFLLLICSLILQVGFGINQTITILFLLLFLINGNLENINLISRGLLPYFGLSLVLISSLEQWFSGIKIPRGGNIFQALSPQILLLNLIWVGSLFYLLFLLHLSGKTEGDKLIAVPQTQKAQENYEGFVDRLKLTKYDLSNERFAESRSIIASFYIRVIFFVVLTAFLLSIGTFFFWRFYIGLSDQITVLEQYDLAIFSLLSFMALIFVLLSSISFSNES